MDKEKHQIKGKTLVEVRLATSSDAAGISSIYPYFLASYGHRADPGATSQFIPNLLNEPWVLFFVATEGHNNIIGFLGGTITYSAVSQRKAFVINDLFVTPSAQKRGIAKALLAELEAYCQGNDMVKLFVDVSDEAEDVIRMFRNSGYQVRPHLTLQKELKMTPPIKKSEAEVFNYLTVMTSVVLGLGLSHLLVGYSRFIQTPGLLVQSWLYTGWLLLFLPLYFTYWWSFWDYRKQVRWNFIGFSFMLLGPVALYLITALYLPDNLTETSFGLRNHYLQIRPWVFGLWAMLQIWGIVLAPYLKQGLKWSSFFSKYKIAQYILLMALLLGFFIDFHWILDGSILIIFWLVLLYILTAHRPSLRN